VSDDATRGPRIEPIDDGPLRYRRGADPDRRGALRRPDGTEVTCGDTVLLCRCGASDRKPFCDGSHVTVGFASERIWKGHGRLVDHVGARVTIHDDRALCAHVEYCVNELPSVFDRSKRPWIDPDGARVEEIIALVRKCPSGALSCTVDGVLYRNYEDREPCVTASKEGPYFVEGGVEVAGVEPLVGASDEHCTLCRCGHSHNKPLCDGRHWDVGFTDRSD
jgi:CDGSH-type Zn-finger protein/uncharacterized Fe-S cluster protein YjdI